MTIKGRLTKAMALTLVCGAAMTQWMARAVAGAVTVTYGTPVTLRADEGLMSFGTILSLDVVSWSATGSKDLLVSRLWDGVYLYPSKDLQTFSEPVKLCDSLGQEALSVLPLDWNGDGVQEAIGVERLGRLSCLKRTGVFPNLRLVFAGYLKHETDGLQMRIPYDNPKHKLGTANGYIDTAVFNYLWAVAYPCGEGKNASLVVGDWAGQLWWLPQRGKVDGLPTYPGERYVLPKGEVFARPMLRPLDENGKPFLLGEGIEEGQQFPGCQTRPLTFRNQKTGAFDLLVRAGFSNQELHYLKRLPDRSDGVPAFRNLGQVELDGGSPQSHGLFSRVAIAPGEEWDDLLSSDGSSVAVYRNKRVSGEKPAFTYAGHINGKDVPTAGTDFLEILKDASGRRFILDGGGWQLREILKTVDGIRLSSEKHPLEDQNGPFHLAGETDPNYSSGFDRGTLWDYDGSGKQHLIIGTDKGTLHLLRQDKPLGTGGKFQFTSVGPLKDRLGTAIKVHNRVAVATLDLDGDGLLDLVLAGATYQNGIKTDPNPGAGVYYARFLGLDKDGLPILDPVQPLITGGHQHRLQINQHAQLQALELFRAGERVLIIATQDDGFRGFVYAPAKGHIGLDFTGTVLPKLPTETRILDLDDDGQWEYVNSGSETQVGSSARLNFTRSGD